MASNVMRGARGRLVTAADKEALSASLWKVLYAFSSLKLTVGLCGAAILLVLLGTLAQSYMDEHDVTLAYFRTAVAWVHLKVLFPPAFFTEGTPIPETISLFGKDWAPVFPIPGGFTIGGLMLINLLAAHGLRFKIQASGTRLAVGALVIALGCVVTWLVIASGSNKEGLQTAAAVSWDGIWKAMLLGLMLGGAGLAAWGYRSAVGFFRPIAITVGAALIPLSLWLFFSGEAAQLNDSGMRILWQLIKATSAGLLLLGGCWLVFKKRAPVVVIHSGIALMMFAELWVAYSAEESQMTIVEGQKKAWAQDIREAEIAVIDPSPEDHDNVVAIPQSRLRPGALIKHEQLPFDIKVDAFFVNASIVRANSRDERVDGKTGQQWKAEAKARATGTGGSEVNIPACYVELYEKGTDKQIGKYLLPGVLGIDDEMEPVVVDGKKYEIGLRFQRHYDGYEVELTDIRKEDYVGTSTPKDYSSFVTVHDKKRNTSFEHRIWMNNPLRFAGKTFYQSGYNIDPITKKEMTTLQVVDNSGWMIPYVACMIVVVGLAAQFLAALQRFQRRQLEKRAAMAKNAAPDAAAGPVAAQAPYGWALPVGMLALCLTLAVSNARPARVAQDDFDVAAFGRLPVVDEGRVKPFDTLARNTLMAISTKSTFKDADGQRLSSTTWLLDVIARPDKAENYEIFRIEHPQVRELLGLPRRKSMRYALGEMVKKGDVFKAAVNNAAKVDSKRRTVYERKLLELANRVELYLKVQRAFSTIDRAQLEARLAEVPAEQRDHMLEALEMVAVEAEKTGGPLAAPTGAAGEPWSNFAAAFYRNMAATLRTRKKPDERLTTLAGIFAAWGKQPEAQEQDQDDRSAAAIEKEQQERAEQASAFNGAVARYEQLLFEQPPQEYTPRRVAFEAFFNHWAPFKVATGCYMLALALCIASWFGWPSLNRASFWLILGTLCLHTLAIVGRIYISGRPPVTNLYSAAVFIGWGTVVFGLGIEAIYKLGLGNLAASISGAMALWIAHTLSNDGDTFTVLQAVLDTQFWLSTHVVLITMGYVATFMAGVMGLLYILFGVTTKRLDGGPGRDFARAMYGVNCFAILFSFFGTVLGGLWADDSWGRFWGWDPKENGALIIVLWNAIVLHARWDGMIKDRGMAILSVGGNIAVGWSMFGVNELGIGLHSYGFTEGVLMWLGVWVLFNLGMIAVALLPKERWIGQPEG